MLVPLSQASGQGEIGIIHDTRHHYTRLRISRCISRDKQKIKFANGGMREIAFDFVYSLKTKRRFKLYG